MYRLFSNYQNDYELTNKNIYSSSVLGKLSTMEKMVLFLKEKNCVCIETILVMHNKNYFNLS